LEPLLERRGAGEWWRSALATLATEGTQETLLKEQEGVGDDGDPQASACTKLPSRQSLRIWQQAPACKNPAGLALQKIDEKVTI